MNKKVVRLTQAINIMRAVLHFKMKWNISVFQEVSPLTMKEMAIKGIGGSFPGFLAGAYSFQNDGGSIASSGAPIFEGKVGPEAIKDYYGISQEDAENLCNAKGALDAIRILDQLRAEEK